MLFKKKYLLAKIESTYADDSGPDGSNAMETSNLTIKVQQGNRVTRDLDRDALGNDAEIATSRYTTLSFEVGLAGSGTAGTAPGYGDLLRACGFAQTIDVGVDVEYSLVSEGFESVTLWYVMDGQLFKVPGARGSVSIEQAKDSLPIFKFSFTGLHVDPIPAGVIAPVAANVVEPLAVTAANTPVYTVDAYSLLAESFSLDVANDVKYRNVVNSERVLISDRASTGSYSFEEPDLGDKNFYTLAKDGTRVPVVIEHGTVAGNIVRVEAPAVQLSQPDKQDSDGLSVLSLQARYIPTSAGDDEFKIIIK